MIDSSDETEGAPGATLGIVSDVDTDVEVDPMIQDEPLLPDLGGGLPPGDGVDNPVGTGGTPDGVPDESMPGAPSPEQPEVGGSGGSDATPDGVLDESMPEAPTPDQPGDAPMGVPGDEGDGAPPDTPPDAPMPDGPGSPTVPIFN